MWCVSFKTAVSLQVNRMVDGRTALHEACKEGYPAVVEVLLEYSPDMECMVCVCPHVSACV